MRRAAPSRRGSDLRDPRYEPVASLGPLFTSNTQNRAHKRSSQGLGESISANRNEARPLPRTKGGERNGIAAGLGTVACTIRVCRTLFARCAPRGLFCRGMRHMSGRACRAHARDRERKRSATTTASSSQDRCKDRARIAQRSRSTGPRHRDPQERGRSQTSPKVVRARADDPLRDVFQAAKQGVWFESALRSFREMAWCRRARCRAHEVSPRCFQCRGRFFRAPRWVHGSRFGRPRQRRQRRWQRRQRRWQRRQRRW